ncbi:MAG: hypothetical protein KDH94_02375, partial [Coxiellaceae bacterium]|nr:hypothetical protein [Coxiellaceae bacterium]
MNEITISGVYKNAWSRLHGAKGSIWSIAALMLLISLTIDWSVGFIRVDSITTHFWLAYVVIPAVTAAIIAPFYAGSFMVAILRARNEPINLRTGFQYKPYYLKVAVTWVIVTLLSELMLTIINIPAIANATGTALPYLDLIGYLFWLVLNTFLL